MIHYHKVSTKLLSLREIRTALGQKGIGPEGHWARRTLGQKGIEWKFILTKASWFVGYWERLIILPKVSIKKMLERGHITLHTLQTIVTKVETVLNERPLTYISYDITDPEPLTLVHLLHGQTTYHTSQQP